MRRNSVLAAAALLVGLFLPGQLLAAWTAHTRADLNLRVGPDTIYGVIDVIPAGEPVEVIGCVDGFAWCDVEWLGLRGFVSSRYLVRPGTSVYLPQYAPTIGVPIISFSFGSYHDLHYRDRSWYRDRYWAGRWRDRHHEDIWVDEPRRKKHYVEKPRRKKYYDEPQRKKYVDKSRRRKVEQYRALSEEPRRRRGRVQHSIGDEYPPGQHGGRPRGR